MKPSKVGVGSRAFMVVILLAAWLGDGARAAARDRRPKPDLGAKLACKQAAERAQELRIEGQLVASRDELLLCSQPACPDVVRQYCTRWYGEVEAELPTIVLKVRDELANDVTDVVVTIDGRENHSWQEGLPIPLDPGAHVVQFTRTGAEPQESRVLLGAGEKNRFVSASFEREREREPEMAPAAPVRALVPEPTAEPHAPRGKRRAAWSLLAVSAAALGAGAGVGLWGQHDVDDMRARCAGFCAKDDVDRARLKFAIADASMGFGAVSLGLATWLFVASRSGRADQQRSTLVVWPRAGGAVAALGARF